jgi:cytidylate kinase
VTTKPFVIAIDGPAASGKGTLAARLAAHYGYARLDSGKLYRAAARHLRDMAGDPADPAAAEAAARRVRADELDDAELAGDDIAVLASRISSYAGVRAALLAFQRDFAASPPQGAPGAVIDGRDIGTVVCPGADIKLFVTAALEIRAERRARELSERLREADPASIKARVLQDMRERDARDSERAQSPLKRAEDAHLVDTSGLDADQVFEIALGLVEAARRRP